MISEVLAAITLLRTKLRDDRSLDAKRQAVAKDILQIYLDVDELVSRGRMILYAYERRDVSSAVRLLSTQFGSLQHLRDLFQRPAINTIVSLHLPDLSRKFGYLLDAKFDRLSVGLELLVGDSGNRQSFIDRMENAGWAQDVCFGSGTYVQALNDIPSLTRFEEGRIHLEFTPQQLTEGQEVLNSLQAAGGELRTLLLDKFKLEDVL